ncbi:hypothetical protein [Arthrobacter methylotrophus]|uniref:hypothetical protein n=1 Tax=Arthrobacter methylotrophus TaxID=121291 RepID=UPI0031EECADC
MLFGPLVCGSEVGADPLPRRTVLASVKRGSKPLAAARLPVIEGGGGPEDGQDPPSGVGGWRQGEDEKDDDL